MLGPTEPMYEKKIYVGNNFLPRFIGKTKVSQTGTGNHPRGLAVKKVSTGVDYKTRGMVPGSTEFRAI